jgi:ribonuclease BN (tRNA processing enzyme)
MPVSSIPSDVPAWSLRFLGVGNAAAPQLGSASVVVEHAGQPVLMVDCGQEALSAFLDCYGHPPPALFITHVHMDHVAGLERLFVANFFGDQRQSRTRLYVPAMLVPLLQGRIADYPNVVAEGEANFWDAFQLIPASHGFWHHHQWFDVFAVRHHVPGTAYGLCLRGAFFYSGDTRPIPEVVAQYADGRMPLVHDCDLHGNPSHTGLPDLLREYPAEHIRQMVAYHYASAEDGAALAAAGMRIAKHGDRLPLPEPAAAATAHATAARHRLAPGSD